MSEASFHPAQKTSAQNAMEKITVPAVITGWIASLLCLNSISSTSSTAYSKVSPPIFAPNSPRQLNPLTAYGQGHLRLTVLRSFCATAATLGMKYDHDRFHLSVVDLPQPGNRGPRGGR